MASIIRHPYLVDENWLPGGDCVFWETDSHNRKAYEKMIKPVRDRFKKNPKGKTKNG